MRIYFAKSSFATIAKLFLGIFATLSLAEKGNAKGNVHAFVSFIERIYSANNS